MKKYIVPEIGITYFETEKIMTGNSNGVASVLLSELNQTDLYSSDSSTKSTGGIKFSSLKGGN